MNKILLVLIIIGGFLALVQPVSAWAALTIIRLLKRFTTPLPTDAQSKLDLSEMLDGADDPDYKFFDFQVPSLSCQSGKSQLLAGKR